MKIIINNTCFVDIDDLINKKLPNNFIIQRLDDNFAVIKDISSIEFINNQRDILNYFDICWMSKKDINHLIKNKNNNQRIIQDLLNYRDNREKFDLKVNNLINNDIFIKEKIYRRDSF